MYGTLQVWAYEFNLGSFGALCKISHIKIFKRLLLPQFSSNFNQNLWKAHGNQGKLLLFLAICLKVYCTLKICHLSYIASIHKTKLVSSSKKVKQSVKAPGPLVLAICQILNVYGTLKISNIASIH